MRVILINSNFNLYGGLKGHGGSMIPFSLCYLSAYARQKNPEVEFRILDSEIQGVSHKETVEETVAFSPDFIGITTNTGVFDSVVKLIEILKLRLSDVPVIIGGPHPSALPEESLQESKADFVVVGEGEFTFEEIVGYLKKGKIDWRNIKGLAYWDKQGKVQINQPR